MPPKGVHNIETYINSQDLENLTTLISRQAAIDTVKNTRKFCDTDNIDDFYDLLIEAFNVLPSAQPEIIRCKDCKHYKAYEYTGRLVCHYAVGGMVARNLDDFCSRAERITDDNT